MSASVASTFDNNNETEGTASSSVNTAVTVVGSVSGAVAVALVAVIVVMAKRQRWVRPGMILLCVFKPNNFYSFDSQHVINSQ